MPIRIIVKAPTLPNFEQNLPEAISKKTLVLAIDSVHEVMTVDLLALDTHGVRSLHREFSPKHKHDALVATLVKEMLAKTEVTWQDLTAYAVVTGPGSWIGSRVGIAAIKAFNLVHPKPIIAIHSINGMQNTSEGTGELYFANMCELVDKKLKAGEFTIIEELEPFYGKEYVVQKWRPKD